MFLTINFFFRRGPPPPPPDSGTSKVHGHDERTTSTYSGRVNQAATNCTNFLKSFCGQQIYVESLNIVEYLNCEFNFKFITLYNASPCTCTSTVENSGVLLVLVVGHSMYRQAATVSVVTQSPWLPAVGKSCQNRRR